QRLRPCAAADVRHIEWTVHSRLRGNTEYRGLDPLETPQRGVAAAFAGVILEEVLVCAVVPRRSARIAVLGYGGTAHQHSPSTFPRRVSRPRILTRSRTS